MNRHSEGYKQVIDQNWGRLAKLSDFWTKTRDFGPKKRPGPLSFWVIVLMARTVPPSFLENGPTYTSNVGMARKGQKQG